MKNIIVAYVIVASAIILLCFLFPYGSRIIDLIQWWPVVGTLAGAVICFVFWAKGLAKRIIPIQIAFFLSVPAASIIGSRNDLFVAEVVGIVSQRYVGGHALKSLAIKTPNGDLYRIEGLPDRIWDAVAIGDSFIKNRGFRLTVAGQDTELYRYGKLWKSKEPIQGEQVGGCDGEKPAS